MRKQKHCEKGKQDALLQRELELELQDAEEELEQGEEWEPNVVFPKHLQERVLEHADREDGLLQMRVFQESIGHLPRLPRDLINLLSDSYVCSGSVFLIGGLDFDVEKKSFVPSKQIFRLDHNGELEECSEMPFPRYQASCVHFEGEILVVGGYSRISYQREIEDHLSPVDFFFLNRMTSACTSICIYNIADDCWRVVDDVFNISSILLGRVSCQIFGEFIFVCGNDGRDVCLSARTLTPPNKKFTMPHRKIKGTFAAQTVLVSGLLICFSNKECSSFSSKNPESNCCGYLVIFVVFVVFFFSPLAQPLFNQHMLDVAALVSGHVAKWVKLPMPPQGVSMCGHIGPDAVSFILGLFLFLTITRPCSLRVHGCTFLAGRHRNTSFVVNGAHREIHQRRSGFLSPFPPFLC